jgi:hypothetical protein
MFATVSRVVQEYLMAKFADDGMVVEKRTTCIVMIVVDPFRVRMLAFVACVLSLIAIAVAGLGD